MSNPNTQNWNVDQLRLKKGRTPCSPVTQPPTLSGDACREPLEVEEQFELSVQDKIKYLYIIYTLHTNTYTNIYIYIFAEK